MEVEGRLHANCSPNLALHVIAFSLLWAFIDACLSVCSSIHHILGTQESLWATKTNL